MSAASIIATENFTASDPNFAGKITTNGIDIFPKYEAGTPFGVRLFHDTDGPVGWINPDGNEATGVGTGRALEVGGYDDILLNAFGSATVGAIKAFGYFDMWHGESDYWRWDPGFNGPTTELQLSKNTTLLYKFCLGWAGVRGPGLEHLLADASKAGGGDDHHGLAGLGGRGRDQAHKAVRRDPERRSSGGAGESAAGGDYAGGSDCAGDQTLPEGYGEDLDRFRNGGQAGGGSGRGEQ